MIGHTDKVHWGHTTISYQYKYANRKTLAISVHPDLTVTVTAPRGTEPAKIREKVRKRSKWICNTRRAFELYLPKLPPRRYINGETHRYLGRQYRLKAVKGRENSIKCLRGYLWVTTEGKPTPRIVEKLLAEWYTARAHAVFKERLVECQHLVKHTNGRSPELVVRKLKMRWGSCNSSGRIVLNTDLVRAPKECIDYVIAHELCHLEEHHHGPRFWRLLHTMMPDYEKRRHRLNCIAEA